MRRVLAGSVAVSLAAIAVLAEAAATATGMQIREASAPQQAAGASTSTAVLSGRLTTEAPSPQPVPRATIRLSGAAGVSARVVGTDDQGAFVFDALPAGTFTLSATKPGYVQSFYGSTHPGRGPGVPVAVAAGQHVEVALAILPGAVITGTIADALGHPAPQVAVAVISVDPRGARVAPVRSTTDDRGVYRVFGLAPGRYLVSALPHLGNIVQGRPAGASIATITDAEMQWAKTVGMSGGGPTPAPGRSVTYAPVYYPGTADAASAQEVSVAPGEEHSGTDFAVQPVPTARLSGTIIDATGQATANATVALSPRRHDQSSPIATLLATGEIKQLLATVSATGFSFTGVTPGDYTIVARTGYSGRGAVPPGPGALWCVEDLTVEGRDRSDLVLTLAPGLKLSGSIVFEHTALTPPADLSGVDLSLQASGSSLLMGSTFRGQVAFDGSFTFPSIVPWIYTLRATPPGAATGARWTLKSAVLNGHDLADGAFEVKPGHDVAGLVVTFTDHAGGISGRLVDATGRPITRYSIVVFPADKGLWQPESRRIRSVPLATDGTFAVPGLPAGQYDIAAAADVDASDLSDTTFLTQLLGSAVTVTLADGEQKRQDLRIGG